MYIRGLIPRNWPRQFQLLFGLRFSLLSYFGYASKEGSDATAQTSLGLGYSLRYVHNSIMSLTQCQIDDKKANCIS